MYLLNFFSSVYWRLSGKDFCSHHNDFSVRFFGFGYFQCHYCEQKSRNPEKLPTKHKTKTTKFILITINSYEMMRFIQKKTKIKMKTNGIECELC